MAVVLAALAGALLAAFALALLMAPGARAAILAVDDPRFDEQWGLKVTGAPEAWSKSRGTGTVIAILDSGIDASHPDLKAKIVAQRDFVSGDASAEDDSGHGTKVAGVAAATTNNGKGVAGMCPGCRLLVAKVSKNGSQSDGDVIKGINWATNKGAKVINISLGNPCYNPELNEAVTRAWRMGVVVVAASGNHANEALDVGTKCHDQSGTVENPTWYPAAYDRVIAVGATTKPTAERPEEKRLSYSGYGSWLDVVAPGQGILTTQDGGGYGYASGTSFAAPHVAGLAGLLASQGLNNAQIRAQIEQTAYDMGPPNRDEFYGYGRIDAAAAVAVGP